MSDAKPKSSRAFLVVSRYPIWAIPFGFLSMALFHFPLFLNKNISFYKLLGSGRNGTFDIRPDFGQWAIMIFWNPSSNEVTEKAISGSALRAGEKGYEMVGKNLGWFIDRWLRLFCLEHDLFLLEPVAGHGTWDGREFLGAAGDLAASERVGVLTRATIRFSRLKSFWSAVPAAANGFERNPGFIYSAGIGEVPFLKQATFSIWKSVEDMKNYAYSQQSHKSVIGRTRTENWYSEEMFLRFRVLQMNFRPKIAEY